MFNEKMCQSFGLAIASVDSYEKIELAGWLMLSTVRVWVNWAFKFALPVWFRVLDCVTFNFYLMSTNLVLRRGIVFYYLRGIKTDRRLQYIYIII